MPTLNAGRLPRAVICPLCGGGLGLGPVPCSVPTECDLQGIHPGVAVCTGGWSRSGYKGQHLAHILRGSLPKQGQGACPCLTGPLRRGQE